MSRFNDFVAMVSAPDDFFKKLAQREHDYIKPYLFFLSLMGVALFLDFLLEMVGMVYGVGTFADVSVVFVPIYYFIMLVSLFISPFLSTVFTYLGLLLFAKKNDFLKTFNAVVYSDTINAPYVVLITLLAVAIPVIFGTSGTALVISGLLTMLIGIVVIIHVFALETIAVRNMFGLTTGRAFMSVVFVPAVLFILTLFAVISLLMMIGLSVTL